jgi:hypothetical protein
MRLNTRWVMKQNGVAVYVLTVPSISSQQGRTDIRLQIDVSCKICPRPEHYFYVMKAGWTTGVRFLAQTGTFLFSIASRPVLGPTQAHIQWGPAALSLSVKRSGREADHPPLSSAEVKNPWNCTSYVFTEWC